VSDERLLDLVDFDPMPLTSGRLVELDHHGARLNNGDEIRRLPVFFRCDTPFSATSNMVRGETRSEGSPAPVLSPNTGEAEIVYLMLRVFVSRLGALVAFHRTGLGAGGLASSGRLEIFGPSRNSEGRVDRFGFFLFISFLCWRRYRISFLCGRISIRTSGDIGIINMKTTTVLRVAEHVAPVELPSQHPPFSSDTSTMVGTSCRDTIADDFDAESGRIQ